MVDLHARTWPAMAIQYCQALEPYGLLFFEEPCPTEDIEATAQVTRQSKIPIATGERLVGRAQFRELFERRACHIIQPDLSHCGGLWEARKIAATAESVLDRRGAAQPERPDRDRGGRSLRAGDAELADPGGDHQRRALAQRGAWINPVEVVDGYIAHPDRPGPRASTSNEREAAKYPFKPEAMQRYFHPDGAVADW